MADDNGDPTVFVVDDNEAFRESVRWLIASIGLTVELHGSARSLLDTVTPERTGCVVADVRMAGISGLELQVMLGEREVMDLVVEGATNKLIAAGLGISEKTVESHRAKVMEKIDVNSLAKLIRTLTLVDRYQEIPAGGAG